MGHNEEMEPDWRLALSNGTMTTTTAFVVLDGHRIQTSSMDDPQPDLTKSPSLHSFGSFSDLEHPDGSNVDELLAHDVEDDTNLPKPAADLLNIEFCTPVRANSDKTAGSSDVRNSAFISSSASEELYNAPTNRAYCSFSGSGGRNVLSRSQSTPSFKSNPQVTLPPSPVNESMLPDLPGVPSSPSNARKLPKIPWVMTQSTDWDSHPITSAEITSTWRKTEHSTFVKVVSAPGSPTTFRLEINHGSSPHPSPEPTRNSEADIDPTRLRLEINHVPSPHPSPEPTSNPEADVDFDNANNDDDRIMADCAFEGSASCLELRGSPAKDSMDGSGCGRSFVQQGNMERFFENGSAAAVDMSIEEQAVHSTLDEDEVHVGELMPEKMLKHEPNSEAPIKECLEAHDVDMGPPSFSLDMNQNNEPSRVWADGPSSSHHVVVANRNNGASTGDDAGLEGDGPASEIKIKKPIRKKRKKTTKREAAKAASAAERRRVESIMRLAMEKCLPDAELLRLKPKKVRRAARFEKPIPSRFCHICSRTPKSATLVPCSKLAKGVCRKVACDKCFAEYGLGDFEAAKDVLNSTWECTHCCGMCPDRAQCVTYQRINDRLRVNRLKQDKPIRKKGLKRRSGKIAKGAGICFQDNASFLLPTPTASTSPEEPTAVPTSPATLASHVESVSPTPVAITPALENLLESSNSSPRLFPEPLPDMQITSPIESENVTASMYEFEDGGDDVNMTPIAESQNGADFVMLPQTHGDWGVQQTFQF